jgi:hypothetical protein
MARTKNLSDSEPLQITLAKQSVRLLERVARKGVYGKSSAEVAARYVERRLEEQIEAGFFQLLDPLTLHDPSDIDHA